MKTPMIYSADELRQWTVTCSTDGHRWVACRPEGWPGVNVFKRLRAAWLVFTGRADVLRWEAQ